MFERIISADYDETAIENGIGRLRGSNVTPCNWSFLQQYGQDLRPFKSDIVVGLAITHHLVLTQGRHIDEVFYKFAQLSNKYVYIEFCPLGMYSGAVCSSKPDVPDWYKEEWFEGRFKKQFKLLHKETVAWAQINGVNEKHRILFVGEKAGNSF